MNTHNIFRNRYTGEERNADTMLHDFYNALSNNTTSCITFSEYSEEILEDIRNWDYITTTGGIL